jgi:hypothetical protein
MEIAEEQRSWWLHSVSRKIYGTNRRADVTFPEELPMHGHWKKTDRGKVVFSCDSSLMSREAVAATGVLCQEKLQKE